MESLNLEIDSQQGLLEALDYLHDAKCSEGDIVYQPDKEILDILFNRVIGDRRHFVIFNTPIFASFQSHLHLQGINQFMKHPSDDSLKVHTFNEGKIKGDTITLNFCEVLKIEMKFLSSLSGSLKDL